jgi:ABC-2 type transport system ATP-binding protein
MIDVCRLTKRFGDAVAVDELSFTVQPGRVTGFLGPNGAGKSTTMRLILGLDRPDSGVARIAGRVYRDLRSPLRTVGALLDARAVHPGRSARDHLLWMAHTQGLPGRRVDEVMDLVGLTAVAGRRAGGFSLGMSQRLGIASALLGDPDVLVLDEPVNGLDAEGIVWIRTLMRELAGQGRVVFVSSHLMSEMAVTAEHLIVIGRGRLLADCSVADLVERSATGRVLVETPDMDRLVPLVAADGAGVLRTDGIGTLTLSGLPAARVAELAARAGIALDALIPQRATLEEIFMDLTRDSLDYSGSGRDGRPGGVR